MSYVQLLQRFTRDAPLYKIGTASRKIASNILNIKVWLPGMGSNHELDRILTDWKLLIIQGRQSLQKHQKQGLGTKTVQNFLMD